jgi:hypothetical protein
VALLVVQADQVVVDQAQAHQDKATMVVLTYLVLAVAVEEQEQLDLMLLDFLQAVQEHLMAVMAVMDYKILLLVLLFTMLVEAAAVKTYLLAQVAQDLMV